MNRINGNGFSHSPAPARLDRRRFLALVGGVAGGAVLAACGSSAQTTATAIRPAATTAATIPAARTLGGTVTGAQGGRPPLVIEAGEYFFRTNGTLAAGWTMIQLHNLGVENHEASLMRLNDGATFDQFLAALKSDDEDAAAKIGTPVGGPGAIKGGGTATIAVDLKAGHYALTCFIPNATGTPHAMLGMALPLTVGPAADPTATFPADLPTVSLTDGGFDWAGAPAAGRTMHRVVNASAQPAGFTVLRILPGKTFDDVIAFFGGPPTGPLPLEGAGGVTSMAPGDSAVVLLDLTPGEYVTLAGDPAKGGMKPFTVK